MILALVRSRAQQRPRRALAQAKLQLQQPDSLVNIENLANRCDLARSSAAFSRSTRAFRLISTTTRCGFTVQEPLRAPR